jgi:hypothetical protein
LFSNQDPNILLILFMDIHQINGVHYIRDRIPSHVAPPGRHRGETLALSKTNLWWPPLLPVKAVVAAGLAPSVLGLQIVMMVVLQLQGFDHHSGIFYFFLLVFVIGLRASIISLGHLIVADIGCN